MHAHRSFTMPLNAVLGLMIVFAGSCNPPELDVGSSRSTLSGVGVEEDPPSTRGSATVALRMPGPGAINFCTGTLITPTMVVTAAHCVGRASFWSDWRNIQVLKDPSTSVAARRSIVGCSVHPNALTGHTAPDCDYEPLADRAFDNLLWTERFDLAILELRDPFSGVSPRAFAPPRLCIASREVPVLLRGCKTTPRTRVRATAMQHVLGHLDVDTGEADTEPGDSGGTIEELDVANPSLLGALSKASAIEPLSKYAFIWGDTSSPADVDKPSPIDWLWSVLDPAGNCILHSDSPCVLPGTMVPLNDADGDGLPDVRDLCPGVDLREAPESERCDGQHCDDDGDFVGNECDVCEAPLDGRSDSCDHADADGDGVPDGCDTCPDHPNADAEQHADEDSDGIADACDLCPTVPLPPEDDGCIGPDEVRNHCDADGDHVGDACDNCDLRNPLQANCNIDSESAFPLERPLYAPDDSADPRFGIGDLCDPTPCGETDIETTRTFARDVLVYRRDEIRVDARAARDPALAARTGERFCPCTAAGDDSIESRDDCRDAILDGTGQCAVGDLLSYDGPPGSERIWRGMTIEYESDVVPPSRRVGSGLELEIVERYASPMPDELFRADYQGLWKVDDDVSRWRRLFPDETPFVRGARGVLWTHTPGPPDAGLYFDDETRDLASHYWSGNAEVRIFELPPPDASFDECFLPLVPWVPEPICPVCGGAFPLPWGGVPRGLSIPCGGPLPFAPPLLVFDRQPVEASEVLGPQMSSAFREHHDARWVVASEPREWLPAPPYPAYAVLASDGAALNALFIASETGLIDAISQPPTPIEPFAATVRNPPAPPVRSHHLTALSATRRLVWMGGGVGPDGALHSDLWVLDLEDGRFRQLTLPAEPRPARVLASAYSPSDDVLWVLDRVRVEAPSRRPGWRDDAASEVVRLLRIHPLGRTANIELTFPRRARLEQYDLVVDPSGALYVLASDSRRGAHIVLRLESSGGETVLPTGFRIGPGVLASRNAGRAGSSGVSLVIRRAGSAPQIIGYRIQELLPRGEGVVARCF